MLECIDLHERGRTASSEEVAEFENPCKLPSRFGIICGPCRWNVHTDLFAIQVWGGPFKEIDRYEGKDGQGEREIELHDENVFMFARLLQYIYYGTYSYDTVDLVSCKDNPSHPDYTSKSSHGIVLSGFRNIKRGWATHSTLLRRDRDTPRHFKYEVHVSLYNLAGKYKVCGLKEHALKKYSTFPFRNHREFYHSVADAWPIFPFIEEADCDAKLHYDREVLRAVVPHIAKFWKEAREVEHDPHRVEARRILSWIKGEESAHTELLANLLDVFAGKDLEEQKTRDDSRTIVDYKRREVSYLGDWTDTDTSGSDLWYYVRTSSKISTSEGSASEGGRE